MTVGRLCYLHVLLQGRGAHYMSSFMLIHMYLALRPTELKNHWSVFRSTLHYTHMPSHKHSFITAQGLCLFYSAYNIANRWSHGSLAFIIFQDWSFHLYSLCPRNYSPRGKHSCPPVLAIIQTPEPQWAWGTWLSADSTRCTFSSAQVKNLRSLGGPLFTPTRCTHQAKCLSPGCQVEQAVGILNFCNHNKYHIGTFK